MQAAAISVRCNGPMGDEKAMKIYSFGEETKPAILLLPGTCCHWKRNFGHVIPLLQEHFYVLCASYDGFDETEDSTFPNMLIETAKLENYIQKNLGGQLFAAYGCSLGGSFVGLMVQRKNPYPARNPRKLRSGSGQQLWNLGDGESDDASSWKNASQRKASGLGKRKWKKKPVPSMRRQCCSCSGAVPPRRSCLPWHLCPIRAFSTSSFPIW